MYSVNNRQQLIEWSQENVNIMRKSVVSFYTLDILMQMNLLRYSELSGIFHFVVKSDVKLYRSST